MSGRVYGPFLMAWLLFVAIAPSGQAETALEIIDARLSRADIVRAEFHQEKLLRALKRPLVTEGKMLYVAGQGVVWQIIEPYEAFVLIAPGRLVEWDGTGEKTETAGGDNPFFRAWADVILAMLSGDLDALRQHFDLSPVARESGWELSLQPKSEQLRRAISSVRVHGDDFVEGLEINDARGDSTTIQFDRISTEPAELDTEERGYFAR